MNPPEGLIEFYLILNKNSDHNSSSDDDAGTV